MTNFETYHRRYLLKQLALLVFGLLLVLTFAYYDLKVGVIHYRFDEIITAILHPTVASATVINIIQVRLPIVIMAIMAGMGLAISGLLLQRVTQNPLACPSLSGIEYGTAFSVIICYIILHEAARSTVVGVALLGALLTYLLIQLLIKKMRAKTTGIILIGVVFNTIYYSAIQTILLAYPYQAQAILYDLNGSLQGITLHDVKLIFVPFAILLGISFLFASRLDLLDLDEDQATALGFAVKKYRLGLLALAIFLATLMTSVIGPLLFFGLIIPHMLRPFSRGAFFMLHCAIYGAAFLLIAVFFTQVISPQTPVPTGLIMLLMAAPILMFIIKNYIAYDEN